jgi:hypothetical protein
MELVVIELDTSAELDATECAVVAGAELGNGHDRWMERSNDGRREYGQGARGSGGGGADEQRMQNPSCDCKRECTAQSVASDTGEWMR